MAVLADHVNTTFGVRTATFDAEKGFSLNGKSVKIKGTCQHQDFAGVGVAVPDILQEYRVKSLKAIGGNGWRYVAICLRTINLIRVCSLCLRNHRAAALHTTARQRHCCMRLTNWAWLSGMRTTATGSPMRWKS